MPSILRSCCSARAELAVGLALAALALAPAAALAQSPVDPVDQGAREQSCRTLAAGTGGAFDEAAEEPGIGVPATWPAAPVGLLPKRVDLRTATESFNRRYEFAVRNGTIYVRARQANGGDETWREVPVPLCFAGQVASIAADDDEMIVLDTARRVYTMDNALKDASLFNFTSRWGTPFWAGPGMQLPPDVLAWSWSVVSPVEDKTFTDPAGNKFDIGSGKVSHIWALRRGGQRVTFFDPWLPVDDSYEICGPVRGRFRAINLSASGSFVFVIGRRGDMFTRLYNFDLSGNDTVFYKYSYDSQKGKGDNGTVQLPAAPWVHQPKIPGAITSAISIHKVGTATIHRLLRVEGRHAGTTGYWERDVAAPLAAGWTFHATGMPLTRPVLANPRRNTARLGLGPSPDLDYKMTKGDVSADMPDFSAYCTPSHIRLTEHGKTRTVLLHHVDGLRQQARAAGLDDNPRVEAGAIEDHGKFTNVTVEATRHTVKIDELGWVFTR